MQICVQLSRMQLPSQSTAPLCGKVPQLQRQRPLPQVVPISGEHSHIALTHPKGQAVREVTTPQLYSSTVQPMISVPDVSQPAQETPAVPQLHWS